jgi:hypothetical protein
MRKRLVDQLSPEIFWDTKVTGIDEEEHKTFIIKRVLVYGKWSDFILLKEHYGLGTIIEEAKTFRYLDKKTLNFLSVLSGVEKSEFSCYTSKASGHAHWNY